jgi:hypothetical protein
MERFVTRHQDRIAGILTGFDRMRFRGTLRSISYVQGLQKWLNSRGVLLKDFGTFAERLSAQLMDHAKTMAEATGRPIEYLPSWRVSKEDRARAILTREGLHEGLIAIFSCVEGCQSFTVRGDRATKRLRVIASQRRCTHLYFYYWDHDFGLMHIRMQTWLPFTLQICVNGREWLAQQLRRRASAFQQVDNCVFQVADLPVAQGLLTQLEARPWARVLRVFATRVNPLLPGAGLHPYYWSLDESEYATDLLFRDAVRLQTLYPALIQHAVAHFHSPDVLRFLGRRHGPRSTGEVLTRVQGRFDGVRIKHWVDENSLKMYDKLGHVLRVETTLNQPRRFKVYRATERASTRHWVPLRKGIADIPRRVELSRAANARYLDALSVVGVPTPVAHILDPVTQRRVVDGRPYRALRPIAPDESALFARLLDGRFALHGIAPADVRRHLQPIEPTDPRLRSRLTGRVSRLLRLYRAHGLLAKVSRSRRYRITQKGHEIMSTALRCRAACVLALAA